MRIGPVQDGQNRAGEDACFAGYYALDKMGSAVGWLKALDWGRVAKGPGEARREVAAI
jgi:hypothetical protein